MFYLYTELKRNRHVHSKYYFVYYIKLSQVYIILLCISYQKVKLNLIGQKLTQKQNRYLTRYRWELFTLTKYFWA